MLACFLKAEELLTRLDDARVETVQAARTALEHEYPEAVTAVVQSPNEALAAARAQY